MDATSATAGQRRRAIAALFARREDPYAGADAGNARRLGGLIGLLTGVIASLLVPLSPPTAALGSIGWLVAGLDISVALLGGYVLLRRRTQLSFDALLALSYLGIAQLALLEWLAGGRAAPYHQLYLLPALYVGGVHPARRVVAFLGALGFVAATPLIYNGWDTVIAADIATQMLLISAVALLAVVLMSGVRAQRLGLRKEGAEAKQLARVDPVTGLPNRRAFDEALEREVAQAQLADADLSVLVADLDDFKRVNDDYGHLIGDQCLRQVATTLTGVVRSADSCFRWGGDEFAVLLTEPDARNADRIGDRLRLAVEGSWARPDGQPMSLAVGHARLHPGMDADDLLAAADLALISLKAHRPRDPSSTKE